MKSDRILAVALGFPVLGAALALAQAAGPAPVNPYHGMQEREEVFEFAEKPKVTRQGDRWVIAFASKAACDATVWVESPDGLVVAHLGSGVLGKNAPFPFQQDSLVQNIEWDGTDDTGKPAPAGCKVRVGLGLKASYERVIACDPYNLGASGKSRVQHVIFGDGTICVVTGSHVLLFHPDGKYLRTLAPHPADTPRGRLTGFAWIKTVYDDEQVPVTIGRGWRAVSRGRHHERRRGPAGPETQRISRRKRLSRGEGALGLRRLLAAGRFGLHLSPFDVRRGPVRSLVPAAGIYALRDGPRRQRKQSSAHRPIWQRRQSRPRQPRAPTGDRIRLGPRGFCDRPRTLRLRPGQPPHP